MITATIIVSLIVCAVLFAIHRTIHDHSWDYDRRKAIIRALEGGPLSGVELQAILRAKGFGLSVPRFYQLMSTLERRGVIGWYERMEIDGQPIKERWFRLPEQWVSS